MSCLNISLKLQSVKEEHLKLIEAEVGKLA